MDASASLFPDTEDEAESFLLSPQAQPGVIEIPVAEDPQVELRDVRKVSKRPRNEIDSVLPAPLVERDIRNLDLPPVEEIYYEAICTRKKSKHEPPGARLECKTVVKKIPGAASKEDAEAGGYLTYRSGEKHDGSGSREEKELWPDMVERSLQRHLRRILPMGKTKVMAWVRTDKTKCKPNQERGGWTRKLSGRNELISVMIERDTGFVLGRKQIGSHLQVLRNKLGRATDKLFTNPDGTPASQDELAALYKSWQDHCGGLNWNEDEGIIEPVNEDKAGVIGHRTRRLPEYIDQSLVMHNIDRGMQQLQGCKFGISEMQFGLSVSDEPHGKKFLHRCTSTPESSPAKVKGDEEIPDPDAFYPDLTSCNPTKERVYLCEASLKLNSELAMPGKYAVATMNAQVYCDIPASSWLVKTTGYLSHGDKVESEEKGCNVYHVGQHFFKLEIHASPTYWTRLLTECARAEVALLGDACKRSATDSGVPMDLQSHLAPKELEGLKIQSHQRILGAASFMQELYIRGPDMSAKRRVAVFLWKFRPLSTAESSGLWRWKIPPNIEVISRSKGDGRTRDSTRSPCIRNEGKQSQVTSVKREGSAEEVDSGRPESHLPDAVSSFPGAVTTGKSVFSRPPMASVYQKGFPHGRYGAPWASTHANSRAHNTSGVGPVSVSFPTIEGPYGLGYQGVSTSPWWQCAPGSVSASEVSGDELRLVRSSDLIGPDFVRKSWTDEGERRRKYRRARTSFGDAQIGLNSSPNLSHAGRYLELTSSIDPLLGMAGSKRGHLSPKLVADLGTTANGSDKLERLPSDFPPVPQEHIVRSTHEVPVKATTAIASVPDSRSRLGQSGHHGCMRASEPSKESQNFGLNAPEGPSENSLSAPSYPEEVADGNMGCGFVDKVGREVPVFEAFLTNSTLAGSLTAASSGNSIDTFGSCELLNPPADDTSDTMVSPLQYDQNAAADPDLLNGGVEDKSSTVSSGGGHVMKATADAAENSSMSLGTVAEDLSREPIDSLGEWVHSQLSSIRHQRDALPLGVLDAVVTDGNEKSRGTSWKRDAPFASHTGSALDDDMGRDSIEEQIQQLKTQALGDLFDPNTTVPDLSEIPLSFEWCDNPEDIDGFIGAPQIQSKDFPFPNDACSLAAYYSQLDTELKTHQAIRDSGYAYSDIPRSMSVALHETGTVLGEIDDQLDSMHDKTLKAEHGTEADGSPPQP